MPRVQLAPQAIFPRPGLEYDQNEEAQFRLSAQQSIQEVVGYLTESSTGTPATLDSGDNDDYAIGPVVTFLRFAAHASNSAITGIDKGRSERRLLIVNISSNTLTLEHEDTASVSYNRIISPTGSAITLVLNDMAELVYDTVSSRWRVLSTLA